jgi:hypothetical protein
MIPGMERGIHAGADIVHVTRPDPHCVSGPADGENRP